MEFRHNPAKSKFSVFFADGSEGVLDYCQSTDDPNEFVLPHVEIPASQRGKGAAEALATFAFEQLAKIDKVKLVVTCPYLVNKFLPLNPQFARLVKR
eukprot:ANDGO_03123.mRNA.1 hypothetical protein DICPUDRAFT_31947